MLRFKIARFRPIFLAAVASIATLGFSQEITSYKPVASIPLPKPVHFDLRSFNPQIKALVPAMNHISENENVPRWIYGGVQNTLPVGGLTDAGRGTGPKVSFQGIGFSAGWPPDCDMAVGPNHVMCGVNTAMAIFDKKTGNKVFQANLTGNDFFSGLGVTGEVISDPRVMFDKASGRWFVHIIEVGFTSKISFQLVAVSDTSNPLGTWKKYRINSKITVGGNDLWLDYPGVAINKDGYVITGNMFGFANGGTAATFVIPKAALLAGTPGNATVFTDSDSSTIQPARSFDDISTMYAFASYNTSQAKVYAITGMAGTPQMKSITLTVPSFTFPVSDAVGPAGHLMDGFGDGRAFTSIYRNGKIVSAHNIKSPSSSQIACRWYEISTNGWPSSGTPAIVQSGNMVGAAGEDLHMPAISVNKFGDISVMCTRNSPSKEAEIVYAARKKTDTLGTLGQLKLLKASVANSGPQPANRWGDYFRVAVDPNDDSTFWGFGELCISGNKWTTWVNSWTVSSPTSDVAFSLSSVSLYQGTSPSGTLATLAAKDNSFYTLTSATVKQLGEAAAVTVVLTSPVDPSALDSVDITVDAVGAAVSTLQVFAYDVNGNGVLLSAFPASGAVTGTVHIPNVSQYIGADKKLTLIVRDLKPTRLGGPHNLFKIDRVSVGGSQKN